MKFYLVFSLLLLLATDSRGQETEDSVLISSSPISVKWVDSLTGDFSFIKKWSYPMGVEMKKDGRAGCADGGFCPERCYPMMDSLGIVFKDSAEIFYTLLDTVHEFFTIECEAWTYEWGGTNFIDVQRASKDRIECKTGRNIGTHSSLHLDIIKDSCFAFIDLRSVVPNGNAVFYCASGDISIDKSSWENGILKAQFSFVFSHKGSKPMYWKGKIHSQINKKSSSR
jgi:hypothetical protein